MHFLYSTTRACFQQNLSLLLGPMRALKRILILWLAMLPVSYFWGIPFATHMLEAKTKTQALAQCAQQLHDQGLVGIANAPLNGAQGETYCHCITDPITLTRDDMLDMLRHQPPAHLGGLMKTQVDTCNAALQHDIMQATPQKIIIN